MRFVLVIGVLLGAACGHARDQPAATARVGEVSAASGAVTVSTAAAPATRPVAVGLVVTREMIFRTGPGATLEVKLDNNYLWKLGENRERAVAKLAVLDRPRVAVAVDVADDDHDGEGPDRTGAAGRHAGRSAAETESTIEAGGTGTKQMGEEGKIGRKDPAKSYGQYGIKGPTTTRVLGAEEPHDVEVSGAIEPEVAKRAVRAVLPQLSECMTKHGVTSGKLVPTLTIENTGRVSAVVIDGEFEDTPFGACAAAVLETARFPKFSGDPIRIVYPLTLAEK